ncbi:MAG: 50S ribosomal protein L15e [Candidatus Micrarchaeota archaeon]|nr:50S ribosomal protein L15e [Candidatus Micrarchaeota archaeon]
MGAYDYIKKTLRSQYSTRSPEYKARVRAWKKQPPVVRVERPLNLGRARELGYKAKQGYIIVRSRVEKGMRKRPMPSGGRKPSKAGRYFSPGKSKQGTAEERASRKFSNCEVLNSYWVGEDGQRIFYEVILIDRSHPSVKAPAKLSKGRAYRGLTAAGKRSRRR